MKKTTALQLTSSVTLSLIFSLTSSAASTSKICVATKDQSISYGSTMRYHVDCDNESFDTKKIITQILIPIPYNWGKTARAYLYKATTARNLVETAKIERPGPHKDEKPFHIFEKTTSNSNYCVAIQYNKKQTGIQRNNITFDAHIYCSRDVREEKFSGINTEALDTYSQKNGSFTRIFTKTNVVNTAEQGMAVHEISFYKN